MKLKELKDILLKLPNEFDSFNIMNGEVGYIDENDENSAVYRLDKPIIAVYVDDRTQEICFFHQTQEDVKNILPNENK